MNIFYLSRDPVEAAKFHCDTHVIKMILESAQLLFTAHHITDSSKLVDLDFKVYKPTHANHPCGKWVRENISHYMWLASLAWCLCLEYTERYNKTHATQYAITWLYHNPPLLPEIDFYDPPQAMGKTPECMREDTVEAYRVLYRDVKSKMGRFGYKKSSIPEWLVPYI
jgi:hypothetical protein